MIWLYLNRWFDVELRILSSRTQINYKNLKDLSILMSNNIWKMWGSDKFEMLESS